MISLLMLVPVGTSLVLGIIYWCFGARRALYGPAMTAVFLTAAFLQFRTRWALAGLLLQSALALCLAVWHRLRLTS